jgi:hypothetical protein
MPNAGGGGREMWFGADEPVLDDRVRLDGDGRIMAGEEVVSILCRSSGNVERAFVPGKMNLETLEASSVGVQGCVVKHKDYDMLPTTRNVACYPPFALSLTRRRQ